MTMQAAKIKIKATQVSKTNDGINLYTENDA